MADVILGWEGSEPKVSGVLQAVLLFGSETWILNPRMELYLVSFQHRVGRQIIVRRPKNQGGGGEAGVINQWRQLWRRKYLNRSGSTSKRGIIRSRIILRRDRLWTSLSDLFRGREHGFLGGAGSRRGST